jgi:glucose-6-phosphate isomerase
MPEPVLGSLKGLDYLGGKGMGSMLELEARSTAAALIKAGRPVLWMEIPVVDAYRVGALIFFFEYATALTGLAMDIDPFDQPGVEQGKRFTYGLMGRPGFEEDAASARERFSEAERFSVGV